MGITFPTNPFSMITVVATSAAAIVLLLAMASLRNKKPRKQPEPQPLIAQALFIDSERGEISELLVDGSERTYAGILGCETPQIGVSGSGYIVYFDPRFNQVDNGSPSSGFRITNGEGKEFKGNGLIVGNSAQHGALRVELILKDRSQSPVYEIESTYEEATAIS